MEWIAENAVADTVQTMNHVIMSVECVLMGVRMGILRGAVMTVRRSNLFCTISPECTKSVIYSLY